MNTRLSVYVLLILLIVSCTNPKKQENSPYRELLGQVDHEVNTMIDSVKAHYTVTELITSGFREIGLRLMADSLKLDNNDEKKLYYGKICLDYGDYEEGLALINSIKSEHLQFDKTASRLTAALNSMDTLYSRPLLDSLRECLIKNYSKENEAEYLCLKGYHYHNSRDLQLAIQTYNSALDTLNKYNIKNIDLIRVYRRMANSYNDLYRLSKDKGAIKKRLFNKALYYYNQEHDEVNQQLGSNSLRLISNEITTAILDEENSNKLLVDAMNKLFVAEDSDYIVTLHPILFSAASESFTLSLKCDKNNDCISRLTKSQYQIFKLINQQTIGAMSSTNGNEIQIYNLGQSSFRNLCYHYYRPSHIDTTVQSLKLLQWSSLSKNNSIDILPIVKQIYGSDAPIATRSWKLLHEMHILAGIKNDSYMLRKSDSVLKILNNSFQPILASVNRPAIDSNQLSSLRYYCKKNDAAFFDYSLIGCHLQIIKVDSSGIHAWHKQYSDWVTNYLFYLIPERLSRLMEGDSVNTYEAIGSELCKELMLDNCPQHNLIISTEQRLEDVPFSALPTISKGSRKWNEISYLGNTKVIRYIPNIYTALKEQKTVQSPNINVLYSERDNAMLPKNIELIDFLKNEYHADINQKWAEDYCILHVVAHTSPDKHAVKFALKTDTISIESDNMSPRLAILQGCRSASGKMIASGYLSLNRKFLYDGTDAVISSYWDADNASSVYYFKEFYRHLMAGETVSESMHRSELSVKNNALYAEWANPMFWANWHQIGMDLTFTQH